MKYITNILIIFLLVTGCNNRETQTSEITITFSEKIREIHPGEDFEVNYIPLEFTDECIIGSIKKVQVVENRVFVLDYYHSLNLFVFNMDGKFITKIGGRGGAPYEFDRPVDFCINEENRWIVIDDRNKQRLMYYDLDDYSFIKTQSIPFGYTEFKIFQNGEIGWFCHGGISTSKQKNYFHLTDSLLNVKWTDFKAFYKSFVILRVTDLMYELQDKRYVYHQLSPTLYEIKDKDISPLYYFDFKEHSFVSIDEIKKKAKNVNNFYSFLNSTNHITAYGVYDTKDFLMIMYEYKKDNYIAIYNKHNQKTYLSDYYSFSVSVEDQIGFYPRGTTENQVIMIVQPSIGKIKKVKDDKLRNIIENLEDDHNPIIGLMSLKNN